MFLKSNTRYVLSFTKIEKAADPWLGMRADVTVVICIRDVSAAQCCYVLGSSRYGSFA